MKKTRKICLLLLIGILVAGMCIPVRGQEQISSGCLTLDATEDLSPDEKILDTAKAALLYEMDTQTLVYAWNADERLDPSGMNKIMTALLALENTNPDMVVTVTRSALNSVAIGSVSAGLKRDEEITMRDLLYCMIVGSANDAAAVIAEYVGSSQEQFVEMMNQRAVELGCENTNFLNPSGISKDGQYSTARDLAKITAAALENELFTQMFCAVEYTVPETNKVAERRVVTTNHLISTLTVKNQYDARVTGGKTGALSTTDRSLICTAEYDGKTYLSVVMSAKGTVTADGLSVKTFGSFEETRKLLDHGFKQFTVGQVMHESQSLGQFAVAVGENQVIARPAKTVMVTLPNGVKAEDISYRCQLNETQITAPVAAGQVIGTAQVWYQGICIGQSDLVAAHDVREADGHILPLTPNAEIPEDASLVNWLIIGGIAVFAIAIVSALVFIIMRLIRKHQIERRHKLINGGGR